MSDAPMAGLNRGQRSSEDEMSYDPYAESPLTC